MTRYTTLLLIFALMGLSGYLALRTHPVPEADFTFVMGDSLSSLDPAVMQWNEEIRIALSVWEGLTTYHPVTVAPIEGVAEFPPRLSDDGLVYTFRIKESARWSNGDPVKADDFRYAWRRAIEPGTAGQYVKLITDFISGAAEYNRWRNETVHLLMLLDDLARGNTLEQEDRDFLATLNLPPLPTDPEKLRELAGRLHRDHLAQMDEHFAGVGIRCLNEHELQVTLVRPTAYFLDLTAFPTYLPVHRHSLELLTDIDKYAMWRTDPQWVKPDYRRNGYPGVISDGPYRITDWQFKRHLYFEANPYYWDASSVSCKHILGRMFKEPSTAFLAYERGEVDVYRDLSRLDFAPALYERYQAGQRDDLHLVNGFGTYFYLYNCTKLLQDGTPNPFHDARVRMAFNLAVNKKDIVDKVKKIGNEIALNLIPPGSISGYSCPPGPDFNVQRARQLLAEAGFPDAKGLPTIDLLYNTGYGHEFAAQAIAEMWRTNLNANVALRGKEIKSLDEDKKTQKFMICRMGWFGDYGDPTTFLDMFTTGNGQNDGRFSYEPYDQRIQKAGRCLDPQERLEILAEAEKMLMHEQMPILPIYYYNLLIAMKPYVTGITPNPREMNPWKYISVERPR